MDALATAKSILCEFGRLNDLEVDISPTEPIRILTAGSLEITIFLDMEAASLEAVALFSLEPDGRQADIYLHLLAANLDAELTRGGSLVMLPETGALAYQKSFEFEDASPESFAIFFAGLMETAEGFRTAVEYILQPAEIPAVFLPV